MTNTSAAITRPRPAAARPPRHPARHYASSGMPSSSDSCMSSRTVDGGVGDFAAGAALLERALLLLAGRQHLSDAGQRFGRLDLPPDLVDRGFEQVRLAEQIRRDHEQELAAMPNRHVGGVIPARQGSGQRVHEQA